MAKNILTKVRRGDENIGKLIVFAVTIIIAVGVLGTLAYFYNQSRENATKLSVLTSTTSSTADLTGLKFCNSSTESAHVSYIPVTDKYTLYCDGEVNSGAVSAVRGIIDVTTSGKNYVFYKVNR